MKKRLYCFAFIMGNRIIEFLFPGGPDSPALRNNMVPRGNGDLDAGIIRGMEAFVQW
jgi:hypothetical protein